MGKRYYCDYCDRSFKDDNEARRKHISSLQHAKNRADHYSSFKEPETILREESAKTPCKRFLNYGDCAFGNGCRFSHYTPQMIWQIQQIVGRKNSGRSQSKTSNRPNPAEIIQEFFQDQILMDSTEKIGYPVWNHPPELQNYHNLPPSLWPVTSETVIDSDFGKWGL